MVRYTLRERKFQGTKVPGSESSIELSFPGATRPGAKGPGSESSREQIGQGPIGRFAPGSELVRERKGSVPLPHVGLVGLAQWLVSGLASTKYRCEFENLNCICVLYSPSWC